MTHLDDERLMKAMDGPPDAADAAHLDVCASCRVQLEDLRGVLARVASVAAARDRLDRHFRLVLTLDVPRPGPPGPGLPIATGAPIEGQQGDDMDADEAWSLVRSVADDLDYDAVREAGVAPASGAVDRAATELSPSEQTALVKLLEEELKRTDS